MIKLRITLLSILPFVGGVMAKQGGGSWDAPAAVKAMMVFEIIWSVILFGLFVTIVRCLRLVPPGCYTRAPYILLSIVAGAASISYLLSGILLRIPRSGSGLSFRVAYGLNTFAASLSYIDFAFEPAVCLWLIHLRGRLTNTTEGKTFDPWVSQSWKRFVDWSLVAVTFILSISMTAIMTNAWIKYAVKHLDFDQFSHYLLVNRGLNFAVVAFGSLMSIDVIISLVALKVTQRRVYFIDPLTTRLVVAVLPFVIFKFIESLAITVYPESSAMRYTDYYVLNLVSIILGGVCSMGIIGGLASTMTIPSVLWAPGATASTLALPVGEGPGYVRQ
ncbi:SubName: Full=Uncharacterized protein {ECO:0000313/EMBL:CCA76852.1} [Serendipita indica DSM 11827]|nr:SubName: Full=Uncharacterized protein {ECO:0000313/EMBL:CCA76852.1} [Serendipita indica DSM 11827]